MGFYLIAGAIGFLINDIKGIAIAILVMGAFGFVRWLVNELIEASK